MAYFSKTFTESEKSEICRAYKLAKDPDDQISILADLNACDKASIRNVLVEANLLKGVASPPPPPTSPPDKEQKNVTLQSTAPKGPRKMWAEAEISELIDLKAQGKTNHQVAQHFGKSVSSINGQVFKYRDEIARRINELEFNKQTFLLKASEESSSTLLDCDASQVKSADSLTILSDVRELLRSIQDEISIVNVNTSTDILRLGMSLGTITERIDAFIERLDKIAK